MKLFDFIHNFNFKFRYIFVHISNMYIDNLAFFSSNERILLLHLFGFFVTLTFQITNVDVNAAYRLSEAVTAFIK